jgi:hypothetical protein
MTEQEWLASSDPHGMLEAAVGWCPCHLCGGSNVTRREYGLPGAWAAKGTSPCPECGGAYRPGPPSERKGRLFGCACCRAIWPLLTGEPARHAVAVAERFADGLATEADLARASRQATSPVSAAAAGSGSAWEGASVVVLRAHQRRADDWDARPVGDRLREAADAAERQARARTANAAPAVVKVVRKAAERKARAALGEEKGAVLLALARELADALRDVLGNPYRLVSFDPAWAVAPGVRAIAEGIYEGGNFEEVPVLGDALEEAGCADEPVLAHCRGPGRHYRGCWLVDGLLEKG